MTPIYIVLALVLPTSLAYSAPKQATSQQAAANQLIVGIKGMTCTGCTQMIQGEITKLKAKYPQIEAVAVNLERNQAEVKLNTTVSPQERQALLQDIAKAVKDAGYEAVADTGSPS